MLLRIRKERLRRGLTQAAVAASAGVPVQTVSQIENGRQQPWPVLRTRLAALFGVAESELFADIDHGYALLRRLGGEVQEASDENLP